MLMLVTVVADLNLSMYTRVRQVNASPINAEVIEEIHDHHSAGCTAVAPA
jgi:hypothetical protein